ncbi:DUF3872 domain-containing protein [Chryseobacterium chendengshani]|uniref:DUF3872 domain-containing protein n=1 Tax=Chryseobacterium sp. LJ668 TaxID=2864040 RepID=UPI001C68FD09|nr:DUF3872 domain-containing protein [Chryseobacterium sp. LJ668]MBW8523797.1 DUF3872 domain-containing protein [Chryseobacterium sp. LJ668]QYK16740.1 DUF3872 domain-containing protein [Chryseobacterium sp. LJ668]
MKNYINKAKCFLRILYVIPILIFTETILSSCTNEELQIQQNFPFEVSVMPVHKDIANDETVEIRVKILPSGNFTETQYYLRYFQFDGTGILKYYNDIPYSQNDSYELKNKEFRLYYTSTSTMSQSFKIWIIDSFGNEREIEFQFGNKD